MSKDSAATENAWGRSDFVLICDHASNHIPKRYEQLGLSDAELESHIAWDPGALPLAKALSQQLDAPLVHSTISRLVIDCNRRLDASDLIWTLSECTSISANQSLSDAERLFRIEQYYRPFHDAIDALLDARRGVPTTLVCVHSFTPVYKNVARPWQMGVLHGQELGYSRAFLDVLAKTNPDISLGWNEPYSFRDGVTATLDLHAGPRGLPGTMIEIRNDELRSVAGVQSWAQRIVHGLVAAQSVSQPLQ